MFVSEHFFFIFNFDVSSLPILLSERYTQEFIQNRRYRLQEWLKKAVNHDICCTSENLLKFLSLKDIAVCPFCYSL